MPFQPPEATLEAATDTVAASVAARAAEALTVDAVVGEPVLRRRGVTLEQAIFDAVVQQMSTVGFSGLTMEGVAACAHTGKAALYRRWQSKEDLVVDALNHVLPAFDSLPDMGNLRDDIAAVLAHMVDVVNSDAGCALSVLMAELKHEHEFVKTLQSRVFAPRKAMMRGILDRAAARGEINAAAITPLALDVGPALVIHRLLCEGPPVETQFADDVIDQIVMPLLRAVPTG
ncbi:MAG: TetR/AcrR family transcriptional regulator [Acidothermaceae bacterium]